MTRIEKTYHGVMGFILIFSPSMVYALIATRDKNFTETSEIITFVILFYTMWYISHFLKHKDDDPDDIKKIGIRS